MKLKFYQHSEFEIIVSNKKNEELGLIYWYKKWKCYVWEQYDGVIMSSDCLAQVIDYMFVLTKPI
jgi:hypothetical protein